MSPSAAPAKKARPLSPQRASSKHSLAAAFETFTNAAGSLERSYSHLQAEVLRLRFELERTNGELTASLEENAHMRRYLARIVEGLPCGVVVADSQGEPRLMNPAARRLLRAKGTDAGAGAAPGHGAALTLIPWPLRQSMEKSQWGIERGDEEFTIETDQGARTVGLSCAVLGEAGDAGSSGESVFLLRDVTEAKRLAAESESVRRKESLAEMATLLAHEIRNPLGSLELFAGLLADAAVKQPELRRWTDHIQAGLRSLSATVNNVLQFHSQPAPQLSPVNLGRMLRESVDFLRPLARQSGLRIDLQSLVGEVEIPADGHRLQQVFFNLALNAFRAMSLGGTLLVRAQWHDEAHLFSSGHGFNPVAAGEESTPPQPLRHAADGETDCGEVRIDFEDTGKGIAAQHLPKIFDAGYTTQPGTPGLGLAVCRTVMEQHRGRISVASEPGKGTTFSLILPQQAARRGVV
jgi:signal transduction histidine kinase